MEGRSDRTELRSVLLASIVGICRATGTKERRAISRRAEFGSEEVVPEVKFEEYRLFGAARYGRFSSMKSQVFRQAFSNETITSV